MPNARRRRFSVKQKIVMDDSVKSDANSNGSKEHNSKISLQVCKTNNVENKVFVTQSPENEKVDKCENSKTLIFAKNVSVDKTIMTTFGNIFNQTNDHQVENQNPAREINTVEKKDMKNRNPRQHRVKVRSPKRRTLSEEAKMEYDGITESLDAIDWDQELEETVISHVEDQQLTHQNPASLKNLLYVNSAANHSNTVDSTKSADENNPAYQSQSMILANSAAVISNQFNQSFSTSHSNTINENDQKNLITSENQSNPTIQSNPVNQPSSHSFDAMCRICHGSESLSIELGQMVSACSCRGTVGRVHVKCLERWLTESGKSRCELCGTRYSTRRVHKYGFPKALAIWVLSQNAKQLMVDSLGIMLMSPLAVVAAWLSGRTLAGLMTPESQQTPWPLASTFVLACMTLVCYYCWIVSAVTRHALGWWIWYRSNYEVRLQLLDNEN